MNSKSNRIRFNELVEKIYSWKNEGYEVSELIADAENIEKELFTKKTLFGNTDKIIERIIGECKYLLEKGEIIEYMNKLNELKNISITKYYYSTEYFNRKISEEYGLDNLENKPPYIPSGMELIRKNEKGLYEFLNVKDGSILVWIPAGSFMMGSNNRSNSEKPVHEVYLDGYFISKYEITFEQYDRFCEETGRRKPSAEGWGRGKRPVINVSWDDAKAYCDWAGLSLPTEAQWEKAAKGGENYTYSGSNNLDEVGWYEKNSGKKTQPVGQKKPNGYGLFDMSGNVWEWCADWYDYNYYSETPKNNPKGPDSGSFRVRRGGSWGPSYCQCTYRLSNNPDLSDYNIGFRTRRTLK